MFENLQNLGNNTSAEATENPNQITEDINALLANISGEFSALTDKEITELSRVDDFKDTVGGIIFK